MSSGWKRSRHLGAWMQALGLLLTLGGVVAWTDVQAQDDKGGDVPPRVRPFPKGLPGGVMLPPGGGGLQAGPQGSPQSPLPDQGSPEAEAPPAIASEDAGGGGPVAPDENRQRPPILDSHARVTIDFVDTDISEIIKYMAEITGRNFILGERLAGKVTIISHEPVSVGEAYEAFLSALEVSGYTTVTVGKATKVMKSGDASKAPLRIYEGSNIPFTDNFVTQIIQMDNVKVQDISAVVKELLSSNGRVIAYSPTNTLILTDAATNIRKIYKIISDLDVAAPRSTLQIIHLKYATAAEVETIIEEVYAVESSSGGSASSSTSTTTRTTGRRRRTETAAAPEEAASGGATNVGEGSYINKIISDERTNSLIIQANETAMQDILDLIAKLDVDVDPASRAQIHVIYLNHAKAEDIATVLSSLSTGGGVSRTSSSSSSSRSGSGSSGSTRSSSGSRFGTGSSSGGSSRSGSSGGIKAPGMGGASGSSNEMSGSAGPNNPGPGQGAPALPGQGSIMTAFDSGLSVASDESTNSLVVVASPEDFRIIKQVIDKLDIRRKQVFVEAVVMEMASNDTSDFGLAYHMGAEGADDSFSVYSSQMNASSLGLSTDLLTGMAMGVFGKGLEVPITDSTGAASTMSVPVFGIALNALQAQSAVNILSTPNILTTDNEEAKIVVGRNIPFPVSTGRDSNNNPIVSYQREDVAITLRVTPQINESNYVTLEVYQEVSEIEEDSQGLDVTSAGFITSKREAETTVVVKDNQTVVIGGLISSTDTEVETKIPVLGDLPLVGFLFRGTRVKARKTNLLIFLTPHVISAPEDLEEVYRIKVAQRSEFLRRFYGKSVQEQQEELGSLMRYSMNLIDEPSVYRVKSAADTNVETIESEAITTPTAPVSEAIGAQDVDSTLPEAPDAPSDVTAPTTGGTVTESPASTGGTVTTENPAGNP